MDGQGNIYSDESGSVGSGDLEGQRDGIATVSFSLNPRLEN